MEEKEVLDEILELARKADGLVVSSQGVRPWTDRYACRIEEDTFLITGQARRFSGNPRVVFFCGPDDRGRRIHGQGIIGSPGSEGELRIIPYRMVLSAPGGNAASDRVIEKRQNAWRIQPSPRGVPPAGKPPVGTPPAGAPLWGAGFWYRALRAVSWPLSVLPIVIGAALALVDRRFDPGLFLLSLIGGVAAHFGTNLVSDYFDFKRGVDTTNALSSHTGVLVDGLVSPDTILAAGIGCFGITAFTGGLLTVLVGWPVLLFGVAGIAGGYLYTGGPKGWKYLGAGELATGFLMGPLMLGGSYFVQTASLSLAVILVSIAVGLLVSAVSMANNLRDVSYDRQSGVETLPSRMGASVSLALFRLILVLPCLLVVAAVAADRALYPLLGSLLVVPAIAAVLWKFRAAAGGLTGLSDQAARMVLPLSLIRLHMWFCLLLTAGCTAAAVLAYLAEH